MSGMMIHIEDLEEGELLQRRFEISPAQLDALLLGTEYRSAEGLDTELSINRVESTIRVHGNVAGRVAFECGRCLEAASTSFEFDANFVLMEAAQFESTYEGEEIELDADDLDVSVYSGEDIDLGPLVREAILLELPILPRCPDERRELCDDAYNRNIGEKAIKDLEEATMDQRWASLKDIKLKE